MHGCTRDARMHGTCKGARPLCPDVVLWIESVKLSNSKNKPGCIILAGRTAFCRWANREGRLHQWTPKGARQLCPSVRLWRGFVKTLQITLPDPYLLIDWPTAVEEMCGSMYTQRNKTTLSRCHAMERVYKTLEVPAA